MDDNMCESEDVFIGAPERIMYQIIVRTQQGLVAMFFLPNNCLFQ